jgi:hypothetical protein
LQTLERSWTGWVRLAGAAPAMPGSPRFGEVWQIKGGVMGPQPLAVPVRATDRPGSRLVTEPLPGIGVARWTG